MKYMGSKNRIAKHILPIILKDRKPGQWYVEPFVGGANVIDKVSGNRIGSDANNYLIDMYKLANTHGIPEHLVDISKSTYSDARDQYNKRKNQLFSDAHIGWIGYMASANGRFYEGGYSGKSKTNTGKVRDYIDESVRNITKQLSLLAGIDFRCSGYEDLEIPSDSIIYCDIPYKGTKQYAPVCKKFNYPDFWQWCRENVKQGHKVFISEYQAPDDFVCVWQQELKSSLSANGKTGGSKKSIEKLFVHESQIKQEL